MFDTEEEEKIRNLLDEVREKRLRSRYELIIEVKGYLEAPATLKRKLAIRGLLDPPDMEEIPSSPLLPAKKKRIDVLKKDAEVRLEKIRLVGDYYEQLVRITKCGDDNCNLNYCYIHPKDRKVHYPLSHDQHQK